MSEKALSVTGPQITICLITVQEIFAVERHIRKTGNRQAFLVVTDWHLNVIFMLVQHDRHQVHPFGKVLVTRLIDVKVETVHHMRPANGSR